MTRTLTMSEHKVTCEQLVLAWSSSNLLGASGLGPVAVSGGFGLKDDHHGGLGVAGRYLTKDGFEAVAGGTSAPVCLEFRPGEDAHLLLAKVYATNAQRAGQYQVHALKDPTRRLTPWDLWGAVEQGVLTTRDFAAPQGGLLPQVDVELTPPDPIKSDESMVRLVAPALDRLFEGRQFVISANDTASAEWLLRRILAVLPPALVRTIPVSTLALSPDAFPRGGAVVVPGLCEPFPEQSIVADQASGRVARATPLAAEVAVQLASNAELRTDVTDWAELHSWGITQEIGLEALDTADAAKLLQGSLGDAFWESIIRHPQRVDLLGRWWKDSTAFSDAWELLVPSQAERTPTVFADLIAGRDDWPPQFREGLQGWLLSAMGHNELVLPILVDYEPRVTVQSVRLAAVLAESDLPLNQFDFRVTTPQWSRLTEHQLREAFTRGGAPTPAVWAVAKRYAAPLSAVVEEVMRQFGDEPVCQAVRDWSEPMASELLSALLRPGLLTQDSLSTLLNTLSDDGLVHALDSHWPEIATGLGVPQRVARMLRVNQEGRWWEFWKS